MKKIIVICSVVLMSLPTFSQTHAGFYGGMNFSNVSMQSPELSAESRAGYQIGSYARSGNIFYGQLGLEFVSTQSYFTMSDSAGYFFYDKVNWRLLNFPIYAGINLLPIAERLMNVRVYAGPDVSLVLNVPVNELSFTPNDFAKVRIDGTVGAGLDILLFSVDAGYNFGLSNVFSDTYNGKAHYAFVNLGLKF